MHSQIAQTAQGPIEYTLLGSGPTVLVLHGTSSDCFNGMDAAPLLEAGFSVLTPSRPGYGQTPLAVGRTAAQAAEAMAALLDVLNIPTCTVIALSGGGPTGAALAAGCPQRVNRLVLIAAVTHPENRPNEPSYQSQQGFYGPLHGVTWRMLRLFSGLFPRQMARQTLAIFSTHDPEDAMRRLSAEDIRTICRFYRRNSSRAGAVNDATHTAGSDLLQAIRGPTLVIHSREDRAVPFEHAEWTLRHIPGAVLCESGCTGHFFWVGPDQPAVYQELVQFLITSRDLRP